MVTRKLHDNEYNYHDDLSQCNIMLLYDRVTV